MNRVAALLVPAVVALALLGLTAAPASAHAVLVASSPTDGARLDAAPATVSLTFDETVRLVPGTAVVISTQGVRVDDGPAHLDDDGRTIVIPLRSAVPGGSYTATYRVVSADTHLVAGSISFGVGQDAHAAIAPLPNQSDSLTWGSDVSRGVVYLGLVLGAGIATACRWLWPSILERTRIRALTNCGWALVGVATVSQFLLAGPEALGGGWSSILSPAAIAATLASRTGAVLIVRAVLVVGLALLTGRRGRRCSGAVLGVGLVAVALTVVVNGHAGAGEQVWLAVVVTAVHLVAMTVWLGGLAVLVVAVLPSGHTEGLRRWSAVAFGCVSVLILSGEYQAWRQVRPLEAMWSTGYGITLSVKLAIVVAMLAVAYVGQRDLRPPVLRRTVPIEAALGLAVLVATTALVSQSPARETYGPALSVRMPLDDRTALVDIASARHGPTVITVTVLDPAGVPTTAQAVGGTLSSDDAGIAALKVDFARQDQTWQSSYAVAPLPGIWTLHLTVEFDNASAVATAAQYRVW